MEDIQECAVFEVDYPFVRGKATILDEDGPCKIQTWNPGTYWEQVSMYDSESVCDALGKQVLTVVSIHKPGRYPTRVFYTRKWKTPKGKLFGKNGLHIATLGTFRRMLRGYRHPYRLARQVA